MDGTAVRKIHVCGGDIRVSDSGRDIFSTVLGSCIATCIYDPVARIGGMNHFLLPYNHKDRHNTRYGDDSLARLLTQLNMRGADRHRLVAKVYGGARVLTGDVDIGRMNIEFADSFLRESNIRIIEFDVGGQTARWVDFHPTTGRAFVRAAGGRARAVPELLQVALATSIEVPVRRLARAGK